MWMARVYYVDVAIPADKKRGRHKTHAVFDGGRVFRVKKLTELEGASEISAKGYCQAEEAEDGE